MKEKIDCLLLKRKISLKDCDPLAHSSNCQICPVRIQIKPTPHKANRKTKASSEPYQTPKPIRISYLDRLMAIKRHPEFIKDYKELKKIREIGGEVIIIRKEVALEEKWQDSLSRIEAADKHWLLKKEGRSPLSSVVVVTSIPKEELPIVEFKWGDGKSNEKTFYRGDYLYLKLDLNERKTVLMRDFSKQLDKRLKRPKDGTRERKIGEDLWEIYDRVKNGGNPYQIMRQKYGIKKRPADNKKAMKKYQRIREALKKARVVINLVTPPGAPIPFPNA